MWPTGGASWRQVQRKQGVSWADSVRGRQTRQGAGFWGPLCHITPLTPCRLSAA